MWFRRPVIVMTPAAALAEVWLSQMAVALVVVAGYSAWNSAARHAWESAPQVLLINQRSSDVADFREWFDGAEFSALDLPFGNQFRRAGITLTAFNEPVRLRDGRGQRMGVLELPESLLKTGALLEAATDPMLSVQRLRWPTMERLIRLLRTHFTESARSPLASREVELVALTWAWVRVCLDGPVSPSHASTGISHLQQEIATADTVLQGDRVTRLREAIEEVAAGEHPAAEAIAELITVIDLHALVSDGDEPSCVLIVRGEGLLGVREWVRSENLSADVVTANEARVRAPWAHAILFGPPERYVSSAWLRGSRAAATAGWLLFAPAAPVVTVMQWAGHRDLSVSDYAPWAGAPTAPLRHEIDYYTTELSQPILQDFVPDIIHELQPVAVPSFHSDDGVRVEAHGFQFELNGRTLLGYFSPHVGPKPLLVVNDGGVELVPVPVVSVKVGDCLLFKTSVAGLDALEKTTTEWFVKHRDLRTHAAAVTQQRQIKQTMAERLDNVGRPQVIDDLVASGMERRYAQFLPLRVLNTEFIAPQYYATYQQLCQALDTESELSHFKLLTTLRTGRRQAGTMLSGRIASELDAMPELAGQLRESGGLMLDSDSVAGVSLLIVLHVAPEQVFVPVARLGNLVSQDGRPWHH